MHPDPSHLNHLGEFASLKNFLGGYYHEDAWEDFDDDFEIWTDYLTNVSPEEFICMVEQLEALLARSDGYVHEFFRANVGALYFVAEPDSRAWLQRLFEHFKSSNQKDRS